MADMTQAITNLVQRAQDDADFCARLEAEPAAALRDAGLGDYVDELEAKNTKIVVHTNDNEEFHVVVPAMSEEVGDSELSSLAGGRGRNRGASCFGSLLSCLSSYDVADVKK